MKIVIIGASFGGVYCALEARRLYPDAEIMIIEKNEQFAFLPNGLLLYLQGVYENLADATFISKETLMKNNIQLRLQEIFLSCDGQEKTLQTDCGTYMYDKLVLATGSTQQSKVIELQEEEIYHYKTYQAAKYLLPKIEEAQEITLIGAGQAGMEAASVFIELGKKVHLFEAMDYPLFKYFDQDFLTPFLAAIEKIPQLDLRLNQRIAQIDQEELILTTVNVHPTETMSDVLATHSDLTIQTNDFLETSQKDIFAVGDLIQIPFTLTNEKIYLPQINHAVRSGMTAAANLVKPTKKFRGGLRMIGTKIFGWYLASVGLLESEAFLYPKKLMIKTTVIPASTTSKETLYCKLIIERKTQRLLGVQLLSQANCLAIIERCGWVIQQEMTIEALLEQDFFFQSQYSSTLAFLNDLFVGCDTDEI
jgi:NADPH-dependent 2,4-dienoyl-CoA reductase/sulfur reductase-like enzyme